MDRMVSRPEVLAIIQARGGSKGIPHKNIRSFAGYPLIAYSIAAGLQASLVTRVILSTDDPEIAKVGQQFGAETPFLRPVEFAQDNSTDLPLFQHALEWLKVNEGYQPQVVVQLRPTSPVRPVGLVDEAVKILLDHPEADSVRGVVPAGQNPHKMWRIDMETGQMRALLDVPGVPEPYNAPRQALPAVYWQTGHIDAIRTTTIPSPGRPSAHAEAPEEDPRLLDGSRLPLPDRPGHPDPFLGEGRAAGARLVALGGPGLRQSARARAGSPGPVAQAAPARRALTRPARAQGEWALDARRPRGSRLREGEGRQRIPRPRSGPDEALRGDEPARGRSRDRPPAVREGRGRATRGRRLPVPGGRPASAPRGPPDAAVVSPPPRPGAAARRRPRDVLRPRAAGSGAGGHGPDRPRHDLQAVPPDPETAQLPVSEGDHASLLPPGRCHHHRLRGGPGWHIR